MINLLLKFSIFHHGTTVESNISEVVATVLLQIEYETGNSGVSFVSLSTNLLSLIFISLIGKLVEV